VTRLRLVPIGNGALIGRRIAIDPAGGGRDTTGMRSAIADTLAAGRAQAVEADVNLRTARALAEDLQAAGAQVVLTRTGPDSLTAIERLRVTEGFGAERVISITHRAPGASATVGHYFSSPGGKALAKRIEIKLELREVATSRTFETPSWLVQQTGAVATLVDLPSIAGTDRLEWRTHAEAYAIYLALLEDFGATDLHALPLSVMRDPPTTSTDDLPVRLDGRWTLYTRGNDGEAKFDGLPAGGIVTVEAGGASMRVSMPPTGTTVLTVP
jgi:hypothetical protein